MASPINMQDSVDHPMGAIVSSWCSLIKDAESQKEERFGKYAREGHQFFNGAPDWMWDVAKAKMPGGYLDKDAQSSVPHFKMQVNRVFEAVALFGPVLFHQYPQVDVTPTSKPDVPPQIFGFPPEQIEQVMQKFEMDKVGRQVSSELKSHYLNWLQVEGNKMAHGRRVITEAIVKGMGVMMTEIHSPRGSSISYPWSRCISCDQLLKDPDARQPEDIQWQAVKWTQPVNLVERKFGLRDGEIRGNLQSRQAQNTPLGQRQATNGQLRGKSYDLIEYYEIYSKNGFGHRLLNSDSRYSYDFMGDFCRIVVADGVPFPLNIPSWSIAEGQDAVFNRAQWPIPFWADGGWPTTELAFWFDTDDVWPISLIKPAIGEIRFVNWCMSFLADKVASACHDYIGCLKSAAKEIQQQIRSAKGPYTVIEIAEIQGAKISDVISFLNKPSFTIDIWKMVSEVLNMIDKRTGLTELAYGLTSTQMRSAKEAGVKQDAVNVRPQDMANTFEAFLGKVAMKECEAAVWSLEGKDVHPILGDMGAMYWDQYIATQDFDSVVRDYDYRVAANSARKPNRAQRLQSLTEFGHVAMNALETFAAQGVVDPLNAYLSDVAEAMEIDPKRYLIQLPPPEEKGPSKEEIALQMKQAEKQLEFQFRELSNDQTLEHAEELHDQLMDFEEEKNEEEIETAKQKNRITIQQARRPKASLNGKGSRA